MCVRTNSDLLMGMVSVTDRPETEKNEISSNEVFSYYIPEGCAACGGPYPYCVSSCPMFDD